MTRIRAALAAIAICWLLAACGSGSGSADPAAAGDGPPAAGSIASPGASTTPEPGSEGGGRWCDAFESLLAAHAEMVTAASAAFVGERVDTSAVAADADRARAALDGARAATPAQINADMKVFYDYFVGVLDTLEQVAGGDRSKYESLTAIPAGVKEPLQRISQYTDDTCEGFVNPLVGGTS
jgi:hypothetical protein